MLGMTIEETLILVWCAILLINNFEVLIKYSQIKRNYIELQETGEFYPVDKKRLIIGLVIGTFIFKGLIYIIAALVLQNIYAKMIGFLLLVFRMLVAVQEEQSFRISKSDLFILICETLYVIYFVFAYFFFNW